jgi:ClpP class serine protease
VGRKAIAQVKEAARGLLPEHMAAEQAEALADKLTIGTWTHDYPIMAAEAKALGLPVSTDMPESVLELMTLYPQPVRACLFSSIGLFQRLVNAAAPARSRTGLSVSLFRSSPCGGAPAG